MLTLLLAASLAAEVWELPVQIEPGLGYAATPTGARLLDAVPTAGAAGVIHLDPRRPVRWSGDQAQPPETPDVACWDCLVPAAGRYVARCDLVPPAGAWGVRVRLESAQGAHLGHAVWGEGGEPGWVDWPAATLPSGLVRLTIERLGYWQAPPAVQGIMLLPEGTEAPPATAPTQVAAPPVTVRGVVPTSTRTLGLSLPAPLRAEVELGEPIRVAIPLDAERPSIGPITARLEVEDGAIIALRDEAVELLFDRRSGGLLLARDRRDGTVLLGGDMPQPLGSLVFKRAGEAEWLEADPLFTVPLTAEGARAPGAWPRDLDSHLERNLLPESVRELDGGLEIVWRFAEPGFGTALMTQLVAPLGGGPWRFAARVEVLEGPADVVGITFPRLPHARLGEPLDDRLLRLQSFGHERLYPEYQSVDDGAYCGRVVMNWTTLHDAERSLYLGVHDPVGTTTLHGSETGGDGLSVFVRRLDDVKPGEAVEWETVVRFGPGGWHTGAREYGDWFTAAHGLATYPEWLRTAPGWLDLQLENYPGFTFDQLPRWLSVARAVGVDWLQLWGQFAYDWGPCCTGWYGPSPQYGGAAGLTAAAAEVRRRGGHVGGYFQYDTLDRLPVFLGSFLGRFTPEQYPGEPHDTAELQHQLRVISDPTGALPPVIPTEAELAEQREKVAAHQAAAAAGERAEPVQWWIPAWIDDPAWRAWLGRWVIDRYAVEYGCDAAYIDVLGTGDAHLDYDPRRGHHGDGGWGEGRRALAEHLSTRGRAVHDDFVLSQEGLGDLPGLFASPMCSGVYHGGRNIYRYAFPDRILFHGTANAGSGTSAYDRYLETFREAMRFDLVGQPTSLPVSLLALMDQAAPAIWQGRFVDTEGVTGPARRIDAGPVQILTVTGGGPITVDTGVVGQVANALLIELDGAAKPLELRRDGATVSFDCPAAPAQLVLLTGAEAPGPWPVVRLKRSKPPAVEVTLLGRAGMTGRCELAIDGFTEPFEALGPEARAALPLTVTSRDYRLTGPATTLSFPLRGLDELRWTVPLRVSLPGLERTALLTPPALDGSFEVFGGDGPAAHGARSLELPATDDGFLHHLHELWLLPGRSYEVTVQARYQAFGAEVDGVLLRLERSDGSYQDHRWGPDRTRPDTWQTLGGEVTTPADLSRAMLYLYNVRSPAPAWFDDIRVRQR